MDKFDAVLMDDMANWATQTIRLAVRERQGTHAAYLMGDGTWQTVEETASAKDHGLLLPRGSIEAIAKAIAEWQGHTSHADTEARVLREWLAVEQARVNKALDR